MTERPNVPVLKTGVGLPTVGSNPTPSARVTISKRVRIANERSANAQFLRPLAYALREELVAFAGSFTNDVL